MEFDIPKGYHVLKTNCDGPPKKWKWKIIREADGASFDVSNRTFDLIDAGFNNLISNTITNLVRSQPKVKVLDVAGGIGSLAAQELAERFGESITVYNADLITQNFDYKEDNLCLVKADAEHLPFQDRSIDLVYSYQYLPYYKLNSSLDGELRALSEIRRVLKPGGIAILDEMYLSYFRSDELRKTGENLGASLTLLDRNLPLKIRLAFFMYNPFRKPKFLVMTRRDGE